MKKTIKDLFFLHCFLLRLIRSCSLYPNYKDIFWRSEHWDTMQTLANLLSMFFQRNSSKVKMCVDAISARFYPMTFQIRLQCYAVPIPPRLHAEFQNTTTNFNCLINNIIQHFQQSRAIQHYADCTRISLLPGRVAGIENNEINENQNSTSTDRQLIEASGNVQVHNRQIMSNEPEASLDISDNTNSAEQHNDTANIEHEDQRYNVELIRLASFANFESASVYSTRLARNGWYSTGNNDQTTCFSCHRMHENWTRDDNPDDFHDTECRFLRNVSNNISISRGPSDSTENEAILIRNQETIFATDIAISNASPLNVIEPTAETNEDISTLTETPNLTVVSTSESTMESQLEALKKDPMGINFDRPKYPSYAILSVRLKSFSGWPSDKTQTPRGLVLAGFFYAGYGDFTRCFFCGGGLRNWEDGDDPWIEHARWFSQCAFVRQNKGQEFIDLVQQRARELEVHRADSNHVGNKNPKDENVMNSEAAVSIKRMQYTKQTINAFETSPREYSSNDDKITKDEKLMNSEPVLAIKRMGYTDETIRIAINTLKSRLPKGIHKVSIDDILKIVLEIKFRTRTSTTSREDWPTEHVNGGSIKSSTDITSESVENVGVTDQLLCKICMEKNVSITFLPCGHLACCEDCAPAIRKCPICRQFVRGRVKTFLV